MKVLLVCSQGMSSAIAAKSLQDASIKKGIRLEVNECSTQSFKEEITKGYNIAMVAPQIRHRYEILKIEANEVGIPCILIKPQGYTPIGGEKLLSQIEEALGGL